ncbi:BlaI/MecI/CopY family transcriptional regulator [Lentisphaera profundi]|uniref:BlaI/MecI/CopY family transcriptional regulator n=1 Tax=Lentisphaera profundi TaxID=1658616 RepID=A0ABY7VQZ7_9BACT|nr:BlaI/MecI/CopY family transcriptional regulator [Lentisphaera profundi]WDE95665.1 BlaI/MecI/CopY family transcriptional regulator [Lentisphaera profundi]
MNISDAEFEVMRVIWASKEPLASKMIISELTERTDWKPKTMQTLISRLVKKQALDFTQEGRTYTYFAKVSEEQCLAEVSEGFLEQFFGGSLMPMLSHFAGSKKISKEEADLLRKLLDENQS